MPATAQGPATCKSGGEYKKIQLCAGLPRCVRNDEERVRAQGVKYGCGMCQHEWVFVETGGSVYRPPIAEAPKLMPKKVPPLILKGVKLSDPKWGKGGVTAEQKILTWLGTCGSPASPAQIRGEFPDYMSGTIKNALMKLKGAGLVMSPKYGFWSVTK